jgi:hypothetical protein
MLQEMVSKSLKQTASTECYRTITTERHSPDDIVELLVWSCFCAAPIAVNMDTTMFQSRHYAVSQMWPVRVAVL